MVDVSTSMIYGIEEKYEKIIWLASVMILIAAYSSDKVALLLYSDDIELYIPARTGLVHARKLIHTLYMYKPKKPVTSILSISQQLSILKERSLVCIVSDFIDNTLEKAIKTMVYRHMVCAIRYLDTVERLLPGKGLLLMKDQETGTQSYIHIPKICNGSVSLLHNRIQTQNHTFKKYGVPIFDIVNHQKPAHELIQLLSSSIGH
jgi:hypothetical protein